MRITDKFVFFWGQQDIYSNFYYKPFVHQGIRFKWSEQAVMYRKAKLFGADTIADKILQASTPKACKQLGRSRDIPFDNAVWEKNREIIYKEVLLDKFRDKELLSQLLQTGSREFAEASPFDKIWGIGLKENDPNATNKSRWIGQNLLGKVLTEVREELREESKSK